MGADGCLDLVIKHLLSFLNLEIQMLSNPKDK